MTASREKLMTRPPVEVPPDDPEMTQEDGATHTPGRGETADMA